MPNLFPTVSTEPSPEISDQSARDVKFGRSWKFDFAAGEFVLSPTGSIVQTDGTDAWLEWCQKAIQTARYRYLVYSRDYGQEFEDLIARNLTKTANESEIKRIVTETLMINPRTATVSNFTFDWQGEQVFFTCEITNVRGETRTISGSEVMI